MKSAGMGHILRTIYFLPSKNTALVIPFVLALGFVTGLHLDTSPLKSCILIVTVLMVFPAMIGFRIGEVFNLLHSRLMLTAAVINFVVLPAVA